MEQSFQPHPLAVLAAKSAMQMQQRQPATANPSSAAVAPARKETGIQMPNSGQLPSHNMGYSYPPVYHGHGHANNAGSLTSRNHPKTQIRHHQHPAPAYNHGSGKHMVNQGHRRLFQPRSAPIAVENHHFRQFTAIDSRRVDHRRYEHAHGHYHHHWVGAYPHQSSTSDDSRCLPPLGKQNIAPPSSLVLPREPPSQHCVNEAVVHNKPLQTVTQNKGAKGTPFAKKTMDKTQSSLTANHEQENRSMAVNFMKSPTTISFERMLGAAHYLANNPTPAHVKKHLDMKGSKTVVLSPSADECKTNLKRKSFENDLTLSNGDTVEAANEHKRARGLKPFLISSEEAEKLNQLGPDNPFVQVLNDEDLYHQVILLMTLEAEAKDVKKMVDSTESVSLVIGEGFKWRDYPPLEQILYDRMGPYYSISVSSRQSKQQQKFNNQMVASIREAATASGYSFARDFTDKMLRDRIRCFYKTHLQNAKKRLATMQKHPTSVLNQSQLRLWIQKARERLNLLASS